MIPVLLCWEWGKGRDGQESPRGFTESARSSFDLWAAVSRSGPAPEYLRGFAWERCAFLTFEVLTEVLATGPRLGDCAAAADPWAAIAQALGPHLLHEVRVGWNGVAFRARILPPFGVRHLVTLALVCVWQLCPSYQPTTFLPC